MRTQENGGKESTMFFFQNVYYGDEISPSDPFFFSRSWIIGLWCRCCFSDSESPRYWRKRSVGLNSNIHPSEMKTTWEVTTKRSRSTSSVYVRSYIMQFNLVLQRHLQRHSPKTCYWNLVLQPKWESFFAAAAAAASCPLWSQLSTRSSLVVARSPSTLAAVRRTSARKRSLQVAMQLGETLNPFHVYFFLYYLLDETRGWIMSIP